MWQEQGRFSTLLTLPCASTEPWGARGAHREQSQGVSERTWGSRLTPGALLLLCSAPRAAAVFPWNHKSLAGPGAAAAGSPRRCLLHELRGASGSARAPLQSRKAAQLPPSALSSRSPPCPRRCPRTGSPPGTADLPGFPWRGGWSAVFTQGERADGLLTASGTPWSSCGDSRDPLLPISIHTS